MDFWSTLVELQFQISFKGMTAQFIVYFFKSLQGTSVKRYKNFENLAAFTQSFKESRKIIIEIDFSPAFIRTFLNWTAGILVEIKNCNNIQLFSTIMYATYGVKGMTSIEVRSKLCLISHVLELTSHFD